MNLHLVNGFLGSGKTTAIIAATRYYLQQGKKVAIVTNDKGHYQVDTAFFQSAQIPTAQVAGGCFRCSFEEFEEQIYHLIETVNPDVLFAESVGSCVDLVNTVFPQLQSIPGMQIDASTFSVFTDIRLFRRWMNGMPLPFSDSIVYTYGKQIDETRLLVLNKMDLLNTDERSLILEEAQRRFPKKHIILQDSFTREAALPWVSFLNTKNGVTFIPGFDVDYPQYMNAEKKMAWVDQMLLIHASNASQSRAGAIAIISNLLESLKKQLIPVAHIKFFISDANELCKLSFTAMDQLPGSPIQKWQEEIPVRLTGSFKMIINARVEINGSLLRELIDHSINIACTSEGLEIETIK